MNQLKKKNTHIETIRGLAILLVVIGHVIGSAGEGGMKVNDDSFLRYVYFSFIKFTQMPLFTVIAGWVYALKPFNADSGRLINFYINKIQRLLIPMVVVGGMYYVLQSFTPGTNASNDLKDIWKIAIFPYTLYWYLQALFFCFVFISIIDKFDISKNIRGYFVILAFSFILIYIRNEFIPQSFPNYFGFKGGIYLLPFFVIGIGFNRFSDQLNNKILRWVAIITFIAGFSIQQLIWFEIINYKMYMSRGIGLIIGVSLIVFSMQIKFTNKWLVWLGSFAYTIYLFHAFGTAGGRIFANRIGITSTFFIFIFSLFLGLFLPVLVEIIADKFGITRLLFLGKSYNKRKK
jgi:glucans biosynthesis protein C